MTQLVGLLDLPRRTSELGRIRMGEKTRDGYPVKLKTFRLTSHSRQILDAAAVRYGGKVRRWDGAPDDGMWEVTTEASELNVLLPGAEGAITQSYELWAGGTCARRCDGTTARTETDDEPVACVCRALGQKGQDMDCEIVTRFRVILPDVPGLGTWLLTTSGYQAAITMPATLELLARMTPGEWIRAVLRAEQRSSKSRDRTTGKVETRRFVIPVIDLPGVTIGSMVDGLAEEPAQLEPGPAAPRTARDAAAARRAQIEARTIDGGAPTVPQSAPAVPDAAPSSAGKPSPAEEVADAREICGALPPPDGILRMPCTEPPMGIGHHDRLHKSPEGGWPL